VKMSSRVKIALRFPCQPSREHCCAYELPRIGKVEDFRDGWFEHATPKERQSVDARTQESIDHIGYLIDAFSMASQIILMTVMQRIPASKIPNRH